MSPGVRDTALRGVRDVLLHLVETRTLPSSLGSCRRKETVPSSPPSTVAFRMAICSKPMPIPAESVDAGVEFQLRRLLSRAIDVSPGAHIESVDQVVGRRMDVAEGLRMPKDRSPTISLAAKWTSPPKPMIAASGTPRGRDRRVLS